jgi:hypothetical protein
MLGRKYRLKEWLFENVTPKLPKIPIQKPYYPGMSDYCKRCDSDIKIYAHHTGDGWYFFWDCEDQHVSDHHIARSIEDDSLIGWFPFLFGWATGKDLERIGIEVV